MEQKPEKDKVVQKLPATHFTGYNPYVPKLKVGYLDSKNSLGDTI